MKLLPSALLCRCCVLVLLAGFWSHGWGQPAVLDLAYQPDRIALLGHLQVLRDETAELEAGQALKSAEWLPATHQRLNPVLTAAALWLRLELHNGSDMEAQRWLSMGNPRLEQVYLYRVEGGRLSTPVKAGLSYPPPLPQARGMDATFDLTLAPGERVGILLRVQGRTSIAMQPELWQPLAYLDMVARNDLQYLLPMALMAGLVLYLLASTLGRRNLLLFMFALWLLMSVGFDFAFYGYLRRFLLSEGGELAARAPVVTALLGNLTLLAYAYLYLEMWRRFPWRHYYRLALIVMGLMVLVALLGPLRFVLGLTALVLLLFYLSWPFSLVQPWREGVFHVRAFALCMWCVCVSALLRMMGYLWHWESYGSGGLYVMILLKLLVAFVLLYAVVRHSAVESRAFARMQVELLDAQRLESERLEEAVRLRSAALRQAVVDADEAVRAKGELLARVGHDLRAPLTAMMAYSARLEAMGGSVRRRALAIGRRAREQLALINGLIEYARAGVQPDAVLPKALYLGAWLQSVADHGRTLAARQGSQFGFCVLGSLPDVVVLDAKRVRQVLELLLTHAAERARQGQVELLVEAQTNPKSAFELSFTVRDDGPAIPAELLPTLFQPFLRLESKQSHRQVGLGLAIAFQWAERMGGRLQVLQSKRGVAWHFSLPVGLALEAEIDPRHLNRSEAGLPELRGAGRLIWVAEDSQVVREMLEQELSGLGFEVVSMADGQEALWHVRSLREQAPDLLLTDLKMPGVDGLTLLRSARARWPDLPVVLLTSAPEVLVGEEHGFSAVLAKPVSLWQLRMTLAELLGLEIVPALTYRGSE